MQRLCISLTFVGASFTVQTAESWKCTFTRETGQFYLAVNVLSLLSVCLSFLFLQPVCAPYLSCSWSFQCLICLRSSCTVALCMPTLETCTVSRVLGLIEWFNPPSRSAASNTDKQSSVLIWPTKALTADFFTKCDLSFYCSFFSLSCKIVEKLWHSFEIHSLKIKMFLKPSSIR